MSETLKEATTTNEPPTAQARLVDERDRAQWDAFVCAARTGHVHQSWDWGEVRRDRHIDVVRVAVFAGNEMRAAAQVTIHQLAQGLPWRIGQVPRGPVCDSEPERYLPILCAELARMGRARRCLFIRVEPRFLASSVAHLEALQRSGLVRSAESIFHRHTAIVDLRRDESQLLKALHRDTRYNLRAAEKAGVQVREGFTTEDLQTFHALLSETARRQRFYARPYAFFDRLWHVLAPQGEARLFLAEYASQPVAASLTLVYGGTGYYAYGATPDALPATPDGKRLRGAPVLLQWESMRALRAAGCYSYDLWGVCGPDDPPDHPWRGFTEFKMGLGATLESYLGTFDLPLHPMRQRLFEAANRWRWQWLNRRDRGQ
jgi:peptidoglycan pentaglycine glycine transferase (the first glycine)